MRILKECLRCERRLEQRNMIYTGGCWVCGECFEIMERKYPVEMAKEYNNFEEKCRGCE